MDQLVPCLKDTETGEIKETIVFKVESRSYLNQFKISNGWHINWADIPESVDVFILALKDEPGKAQGIVGVKNDISAHAAYVHWACTAPSNNKHEYGRQKYEGVGGHLFAIAADQSMRWGYEGVVHGFAANVSLLKHYMEVFDAEYLGMLHQYQFFIGEAAAKKLLEVYRYEWN